MLSVGQNIRTVDPASARGLKAEDVKTADEAFAYIKHHFRYHKPYNQEKPSFDKEAQKQILKLGKDWVKKQLPLFEAAQFLNRFTTLVGEFEGFYEILEPIYVVEKSLHLVFERRFARHFNEYIDVAEAIAFFKVHYQSWLFHSGQWCLYNKANEPADIELGRLKQIRSRFRRVLNGLSAVQAAQFLEGLAEYNNHLWVSYPGVFEAGHYRLFKTEVIDVLYHAYQTKIDEAVSEQNLPVGTFEHATQVFNCYLKADLSITNPEDFIFDYSPVKGTKRGVDWPRAAADKPSSADRGFMLIRGQTNFTEQECDVATYKGIVNTLQNSLPNKTEAESFIKGYRAYLNLAISQGFYYDLLDVRNTFDEQSLIHLGKLHQALMR